MSDQRRSVWGVEPGEQRRPRAIHGLIAVLLLGLAEVIARLFSFPLTLPLPFGKRLLTWFSPATTVQVVGGMWFGMWGVIAGTLFPVLGGFINGEPVLSLLLIPVNIVQSLAPVWAFRCWKLDPRLITLTDWLVFILVTGLLMNIPAALWTVAAYRTVGIAHSWWFFASFVLGHGLPPTVLGAILLKVLSGVVVESRLFCKGWWA
jgi:hypothetical protein